MVGHTTKEIEIGQDPVISPKTGKNLSRSEIENQEQMKSFRMSLVCVQDPYFLEHNTSANLTEKIKTDFIMELSLAQEKISQIQTDDNPWGLANPLVTEESQPSEQAKPGQQKSHSLNLPYALNLTVNVGHLSREMDKFVEKFHSTHIIWCKTLCFFRQVVLKEVLLIKCCIEKECLGLKELLKTTESAVQDESGTCKKIFSSDIDVVKSEEVVESEIAMEYVEAMIVIANANDTQISNSPLKKPAQILQKRQSEEYIREVKRLCLKDQEISELKCTDDFNWQECSDTVPKYLGNTSCNQYGHNKNTLCTNEADRKGITETMKTSETNILQEITSTDEVVPFEAKMKFCEDEEKQSDPNSL